MATHPEPGKPTRPEDQQGNPSPPDEQLAEDAAFAELTRGGDDPTGGDPPPTDEASAKRPASMVDLGMSGQAPAPGATPADQQSFPWETLAHDQAESGAAPPPKIDSPSDADVLAQAAREGDEPVSGADLVPDPESSRVNLGEPPPPFDPLQSSASAEARGSDSAVDLESQAEVVLLESSGNLGQPGVADVTEDSAIHSGVGLGAAPVPSGSHSDIQVGAAPVPSGSHSDIDIGPAPVPSGSHSDIDIGAKSPRPAGKEGEDSSSINLGGTPATQPGDASSGLDLEGAVVLPDEEDEALGSDSGLRLHPGEALPDADMASDVVVGADGGSGIDIGEGPVGAVPQGSSSGLEFGEGPAPEGASSSIDLGARPRDKAPERDFIAEAVESGVDLRGDESRRAGDESEAVENALFGPAAAGEESSAVDLGASSPPAGDEAVVDADAAAASDRGLFEEEPARAAEEEVSAPAARPARAEADKGAKKTAPAPSRGKGAVIGSLAGGVAAGFVLFAGLWAFGIEPPGALRDVVGTDTDASKPIQPNNRGGTPPPPIPTVSIDDRIRFGDFREEPPAVADPTDKEALAAHAEYSWLRHLQQNGLPKDDDPAVAKLREDLKDADTADGLYLRGHIEEVTKHFDEARKLYQQGMQQFPNDPRFQGALNRMDVLGAGKPAAPAGASSRLPRRWQDLPRLLTLAMGQPPVGQPPPPPVGEPATKPEAGFAFWKAMKLAQQGQYAQARKELEEARKRHEARRLENLRRAQNPISDPTEEIFLKTLSELSAYLQLQERLYKYPEAAKKTPPQVLGIILTDLQNARTAATTAAGDLDKLKKETGEKITTLEAGLKKAKRDAMTDLAERDKTIKKLTTAVKAEQAKAEAAADRAAKVEAEKKDLEKTIARVADKLKLPNLDPRKDETRLLAKVDDVIALANAKDPGGRLGKVMEENTRLKDTLAQRWAPEVMLNHWAALLQDRNRKRQADAALKDVERVKGRPNASADAKARALYVEGLALRNKGEYVKAKESLSQALKTGNTERGAWRAGARRVLNELTDPSVYYVKRIEARRNARNYDAALKTLEQALAVFPENNGPLLALSALVRLEAAQAKAGGKLDPSAPGVMEAQKDAAAAVKAGAAEGHHAAGRIAEALGRRDEAAASYGKAIEMAPAGGVEAARCRVALARLLARGIPNEADLTRATKLAEEVLARQDIDQHPLLKAQALAVKDLWTQALNTDVEGLAPHLSREQADGLRYIVANHPLQRRPDVSRVSQPFQAERYYAAGLGLFHDGKYQEAEDTFLKAIENFGRDARYHYFLGLSRLRQSERGFNEDFEAAARLELADRPGRAAVDTALERIQGPARRLIDDARNRVR